MPNVKKPCRTPLQKSSGSPTPSVKVKPNARMPAPKAESLTPRKINDVIQRTTPWLGDMDVMSEWSTSFLDEKSRVALYCKKREPLGLWTVVTGVHPKNRIPRLPQEFIHLRWLGGVGSIRLLQHHRGALPSSSACLLVQEPWGVFCSCSTMCLVIGHSAKPQLLVPLLDQLPQPCHC